MFELVKELHDGAEVLKKSTTNPISLNAGCELFIAFVTLFPHESDVSLRIDVFAPFTDASDVRASQSSSPSSCGKARSTHERPLHTGTRLRSSPLASSKMIQWWITSSVLNAPYRCSRTDNDQILTHSYSRVVMKALLHAHKTKRISVYVTEARPRGLGYVVRRTPSVHRVLTSRATCVMPALKHAKNLQLLESLAR